MKKEADGTAWTQTAKKYYVPALEKGLRILELLAASPGGGTYLDISRQLGISRTTAFSILHNLTENGYVKKGADGSFRADFKIFSLGMDVARHVKKSEIFMPVLLALRDELGHTVHVCGYGAGETVVLEKLDGAGSVTFKSYLGERKPLHLSAGGKAILSYLPEDEFQAYASGELRKMTGNTLCTKRQLLECRGQTRRDGYSLDDEEGEAGVFCFGVPIFTWGGELFGSISVSAIKASIDTASFQNCRERLVRAGDSISAQLGYDGPYPVLD